MLVVVSEGAVGDDAHVDAGRQLEQAVWGLSLGTLTAVASAAAFNWFHLAPTGRFTIADEENWVALVVFLAAPPGTANR